MKKEKLVKPDEAISLGAIEVARYGKNIVWSSNWTKEQHEKVQQNWAEQYPTVVKEIDELVDSIVSAVQRLPPEQLLHRAWTNLFISSQHIEVEADVGMEDGNAMRMVDYVQSIIAASTPNLEQQDEVTEEDWQYLSAQVEELFRKINFEYHICATAKRKLSGDDFDDAMETFLFKSQMYWCNVRGDYYQVHQVQSLADLLIPQSDIIQRVFGISGEDLIAELEKIWHSLTFGIQEVMETLDRLRLEVMDDVQIKP